MNKALIRIISGAIYALLLLLAILNSEYTFAIIVFLFGLFALRELQQLLHLNSKITYLGLVVFMLFFSGFHYFHFEYAVILLMIMTLIVDIFLIRDLVIIKKIPIFESRKYLLVVFYLFSSLVFLTLIPYQNPQHSYDPNILIGVFVLIWTNDSFAYAIGKTFGRRKLFERISPNKTIEGFVGGLVFTLVAGYIVFRFTHVFSPKIWILLGLITSIFGTFGDLIQSKLKRQAGVKDSGRLMPGHGGLLDRLDSILFAATFIYSFLLMINHVS